MCMLLCERNLEVSRSVALALRNRGIADVQIADDAASATRMLDRYEFVVAVVDPSAQEHDGAELVRSLSARGAEVIIYSHQQPEPAEFADLHYIFVDKQVTADDLAHVAAAQRRVALKQPRA